MDLGSFPGASSTEPQAISGDGRVVVGDARVGSLKQLYRWSADQGSISLGSYSDYSSTAAGVNRDGRFVVGSAPLVAGKTFLRAFRWDATGGFTDLGTLGGNTSVANGISNDGAVVVGSADTATSSRAFRWEAGKMQDLGTLKTGETSVANGVSGDGAVVVGNSGAKAFRWDAVGKMVDLGTLGGTGARANATNQNGSVVVGGSGSLVDGKNHAFRWTAAGGIQDLGTLGGGGANAYDVSANGSVVVGYVYTQVGNYVAFRWDAATGMVALDGLTGYAHNYATSISDDGTTIVGYSEGSDTAAPRAFIWKGEAGTQDLANLQISQIVSAEALGYLTASQNRRVRDLNQPQCIPEATQLYCLSVGATGYKGEGESNGDQKIGQAAGGLRINEQFAVGANSNVADANLRSDGAKQTSGFGVSLWAAYQQTPDNLGWTGSASVGMGQSDNTFERGADLADVQRAKASTKMSSTGLRTAIGYGLKVDTTTVTPEIALSHVNTDHDGYTEHNVAFPLTVESGSSTETYATFGVRSATPLSPKATLHLGAAVDVLLSDSTDAIEGHSQVPGLSNFKVDTSLDKRALVPVAMAGYSYALDANQSLGAQVQVGAGTYEQQKAVFGVGVQYKYAF